MSCLRGTGVRPHPLASPSEGGSLSEGLRSDNEQVALKAAVTWLAEAHGKPAATRRIETPAQTTPAHDGGVGGQASQLERKYGREALTAERRDELPEGSGG